MSGIKHYQKGQQFLIDQNPKAALKELSRAIELEPNNADYHSEKGVALFHLNRKIESISELNIALKLEPDNPYRYSSRAYLKDSMGDTKGAVEDYLICTKMDPEDAIAFNNLGILEDKLGRKQKAKERFEKADDLAKILDDNNISVQGEPVKETYVEPTNLQQELNIEKKLTKEKGASTIMVDVFRSRKTRKEFINFIKKGFKSGDNELS
ncbi:MAG: Flp pilus assembly protein TadD [Parvicellaceae bacterium]|jgi:Flp pilus assembly protein TadD